MPDSFQKLLKYMEQLREQGRDEVEEAEAIAASFKERARKRRRVGPSPYEDEPDADALSKQLTTREDAVPEGLDVDDSGYEMYMIRVSLLVSMTSCKILRPALDFQCAYRVPDSQGMPSSGLSCDSHSLAYRPSVCMGTKQGSYQQDVLRSLTLVAAQRCRRSRSIV